MKTNTHTPEVLEARIAPAQYFLSGTPLAVVDASNANANNVGLANSAASDLAVVLHHGDTLVLDTNGNHVLDAGETVFAKLTGGSAAFFIKDKSGDMKVGADEITGLAVGKGFHATITGDVNGDVATTLADDGTFTPDALKTGAIAGLKVSGRVTGKILGGGSISNVMIGGTTAAALASVSEVRAGTAADGQLVSYNGGGKTFTPALTAPAPGTAGASISNVTLAGGATHLEAGAGAASTTGAGGKGGSVSKVTFLETHGGADIFAGAGGASTAAKGNGGGGGALQGIHITGSTVAGALHLTAGAGGSSAGGTGGAGGAISSSSLSVGDATGEVMVFAGKGGLSGQGKGGAGGAVNGFDAKLANLGGMGFGLAAGEGNDGGKNGGGVGGATSRINLNLTGHTMAVIDIDSGQGGNANLGDGRGGNGGAVTNVVITKTSGLPDEIFVDSHGGGRGFGMGAGGSGGNISNVTYHGVVAATALFVGNDVGGGDAIGDGAHGGTGGSVSGVKLDVPANAAFADAAYIYAGDGGTSPGIGSKGGNGGNVSALRFACPGSFIRINNGSNHENATAGDGGSGPDSVGGNGGGVSGVSGVLGKLTVAGQPGGSAEGFGGAGGAVKGINLTTVTEFVQSIAGGIGGDSAVTGTPGRGGSISGINVPGDIGDFTAAFGVDPLAATDMGGLIAGQGGARPLEEIDPTFNGTISGVTAQRIAAIIAGDVFSHGGSFNGTEANALTMSNAVSKISGLKVAHTTGADNGTSPAGSTTEASGFTFTDNAGLPNPSNGIFQLGDGDTAIDGLVIVLAGKGTFPAGITPLKLIEVALV